MSYLDVPGCVERINYVEEGNITIYDEEEEVEDIELLYHQKKIVKRMREQEEMSIDRYECNGIDMRSIMGVLGDKPGTGKTYEVAALISKYPTVDNKFGTISQYGENLVQLQENTKNCINLDCNLIVVPHYLVNQWLYVLKKIPNYVYRIQKQVHIDKFNVMRITRGSIVIVSSTFYNRFMSRYTYISWSRVVFDEADKIDIPNCIKPKFKFVWFVTASLMNLMFPTGEYYYRDSQFRIRKMYIDGINKKGFINNVFTTLECKRINTYLRYIYVKCTDELLQSSFEFPQIEKNILICEEPMYVKILNGVLGRDVLQHLNAGDIDGAIQRLGANVETKLDIVTLVTENIQKEVHNKKQKIKYIKSQILEESEKERRIVEEEKRIMSLKDKLSSIKNRLEESECPICLDKAINPVVLKCCHRIYCLECISSSMQASVPTCPICRGDINYENLCVVSDKKREVEVMPTKTEELNRIIKQEGKHLIFSSFDISDKITTSFDSIIGSHSRIENIINRYNNGIINVLLLNPYYYGNGLNLTETTDIIFYHKMTKELENQIIGRVCRIGKTDTINVYYLYHNNEITTD